jgi:hypothetical protein
MNLSLHRSITFWSGLFVMLSLCWAWRDSTSHFSYLVWKRVSARSYAHGIVITTTIQSRSSRGWLSGRRDLDSRGPLPDPYPMLVRGTTTKLSPMEHYLASERASTFREQVQANMNASGPGNSFLYIPYWLILLLFALLWSTLLLARARRRNRIPSAPNPGL